MQRLPPLRLRRLTVNATGGVRLRCVIDVSMHRLGRSLGRMLERPRINDSSVSTRAIEP